MQSLTSTLFTYNSSDNISVNYFIWDINLTLSNTDLVNNNRSFFLDINYSIVNSLITSTINLPIYFQNSSSSSSLQVRYLAIYYDVTSIQQNYLNYRFESQSQSNNISSNFISFTMSSTNLNNPYVAILGLKSFTLDLVNPYFYYYLGNSSNNLFTVGTIGFNPFPIYTYNFFAVLFYDCYGPLFYLNYTDFNCYDKCADG